MASPSAVSVRERVRVCCSMPALELKGFVQYSHLCLKSASSIFSSKCRMSPVVTPARRFAMRLWIGSILVLAGATSMSASSLDPFAMALSRVFASSVSLQASKASSA